jgi:hypothetical protein
MKAREFIKFKIRRGVKRKNRSNAAPPAGAPAGGV